MSVKNVDLKMDGDICTIKIDMTETYGLSSTGKSLVVASTGGFLWDGDFGIQVNVIKRSGKTKK